MLYIQQNKLENAKRLFKKSIQMSPNDIVSHLSLGNIHRLQGDLQQAERSYQRALQIQPGFLPALINLGRTYMETGAETRARSIFENILRMDPQNKEAHESLAELTQIPAIHKGAEK